MRLDSRVTWSHARGQGPFKFLDTEALRRVPTRLIPDRQPTAPTDTSFPRRPQTPASLAGTPLARWMANLRGFREANAWRYIACLDEALDSD